VALVISGPARIPGPFGTTPVVVDGVHPTMPGDFRGPAGYRPLYDTKTGAKTDAAPPAVKKVFTVKMPSAFDSASTTTKIARVVEWPLFGTSGPRVSDIAQGSLPNCPLPTILAAMANTASGRTRILQIVTEHAETSITDLSGVADDISDQTGSLSSKRYFSVKLSKVAEVTDVFYTDDADQGWNLLYMHASGNGNPVLWPAIIEKAYAMNLGGYAKLNEMQVNTVWKEGMGADPHGFSITPKTDVARIREQAEQASKRPVILASSADASIEAASKQKVVRDHGYAVLGIEGNTIKLYNPWGEPVSLPVTDIPKFFQAMFYP
jgi:hypothetical protein